MPTTFLIYGAYGYTGELIARRAVQRGHAPRLAGRDEAKLKPLALELGLPYETFELAETTKLDESLGRVDAVLHCAGPFSRTARTVVDACLRHRKHYLDITGEVDVFEWIATRHEAARRAGVVLLPGTGFDVVPSDCLAAHLRRRLPDAEWLELALQGPGRVSRGTALTMVEGMTKGGLIRQNGALKKVPTAFRTRKIPFGGGQQLAASIPWGDVATAYYSTGIPNVIVYLAVTPSMRRGMWALRYLGWLLQAKWIRALLKKRIRATLTGPDHQHRRTARSYLWGEARNRAGQTVTARLQTPEAYHLTATTALLAMERVLAGGVTPGFQTPARAFGPDFILEVDGVKRDDE
ncbi:MAG: saccharopine dehydrogenase NADP-binding domain-containing protein [Ferruginibacter sp.]|nr:saccharopine dehydrogenase NADP-binding domain-containing protein [Cytophagales bacterium]